MGILHLTGVDAPNVDCSWPTGLVTIQFSINFHGLLVGGIGASLSPAYVLGIWWHHSDVILRMTLWRHGPTTIKVTRWFGHQWQINGMSGRPLGSSYRQVPGSLITELLLGSALLPSQLS